jgi:hypothetical protein
MNELVILTIHLVEVTKDVIEVLAIDILPPFSNRCNSHVENVDMWVGSREWGFFILNFIISNYQGKRDLL